jgi:hypothetical protein
MYHQYVAVPYNVQVYKKLQNKHEIISISYSQLVMLMEKRTMRCKGTDLSYVGSETLQSKRCTSTHLFNVIVAVYSITKCLTQVISKSSHIIIPVSEVIIITIPTTIM